MRLQDAKAAGATAREPAPQTLPPLVRMALLTMPAPFFWNPPAWVIALMNPATARAATLALAACHPLIAPQILRALANEASRE